MNAQKVQRGCDHEQRREDLKEASRSRARLNEVAERAQCRTQQRVSQRLGDKEPHDRFGVVMRQARVVGFA